MTLPLPTAALLLVASREVGVHESGGNNLGARVEQYLAAVGLPGGNPWCAAFVAFCMREAGIQGWPMTGDTWALRSWAQQHGCYTSTPDEEDVFLLLDGNGDPMHTGLVTAVRGAVVDTVEGNTGMVSDTDGDGVARKSRSVTACRFIHWQGVLSATPAHPAAPPEPACAELWWHDGRGSLKIDGVMRRIVGVKMGAGEADLAPWPGGYIRIGLT